MRALTFVEGGTVEWREAEEPRVSAPGQAIVRPLAVASCDLDQAIVHGGAPFPGPFTLGHEFVARVTEVGDAVDAAAPGDLVVVPFQVSCGECARCRAGQTASCHDGGMYGIGAAGGDRGGALSDAVLIPFANAMLIPAPEGVSPLALASASDNVSDAWRTVSPALEDAFGARVLVLAGRGANSIALYAVQHAAAAAAEAVEVLTTNERTAREARELGAEATHLDAWPEVHGRHDVVVDSANDPKGLACALRSLRGEGVCTSVSIYFGGDVAVPMLDLYLKGATLRTGRVNSRTVLPAVLEAIESGRIDPRLVTSETVAWEDAAEAILSYTTKLIVHRELDGPAE